MQLQTQTWTGKLRKTKKDQDTSRKGRKKQKMELAKLLQCKVKKLMYWQTGRQTGRGGRLHTPETNACIYETDACWEEHCEISGKWRDDSFNKLWSNNCSYLFEKKLNWTLIQDSKINYRRVKNSKVWN